MSCLFSLSLRQVTSPNLRRSNGSMAGGESLCANTLVCFFLWLTDHDASDFSATATATNFLFTGFLNHTQLVCSRHNMLKSGEVVKLAICSVKKPVSLISSIHL
ncbi:unnamed protein product [Ilex paraguariensis]|uniref:Uncharacterized protein n=1 Tax=Ilex paraguariensis TaxID=185542 RepID=A0ABC8T125_9AQUA